MMSLLLGRGRQPLFIWTVMFFMRFIDDPFLAGRLVSVVCGALTMIGLWFLAFQLFKNKKIAFLTSLIYVFYPFAQVHDRIMLLDSMVSAFLVWSLYFGIVLVKKVKLDTAYTLGFLLGGGLLTKTNAIFSVYLLPLNILLFDFSKKRKKQFLKLLIFIIIAIAVSQILTLIMKLNANYRGILDANGIFVYPVHDWIKLKPGFIFKNFIENFGLLSSWLFEYLTPAYAILILISLVFIKKFPKEKILLFLYFLTPFVLLSLFGRLLFPRYILPMTMTLLPLAALGLFEISKRVGVLFRKQIAVYLLIALFLIYPAYVSLGFAIDPSGSRIPKADVQQYTGSLIKPWTLESVKYFEEKAKKQKIFVAQEGFIGWLPYALEIYLHKNQNIILKNYDPNLMLDKPPKEVFENAKSIPSYFVLARFEKKLFPESEHIKIVISKKEVLSGKNYYYTVYEINP